MKRLDVFLCKTLRIHQVQRLSVTSVCDGVSAQCAGASGPAQDKHVTPSSRHLGLLSKHNSSGCTHTALITSDYGFIINKNLVIPACRPHHDLSVVLN